MDWINKIIKVNNKFKFQLFGKQVQNLDKCYTKMSQYDSNNTGIMSQHAFNLFLNSFGVFLSTQQLRTIRQGFSKNNGIDYLAFINNIRHDISQKRLATIDHCFQQLKNKQNLINLSQLIQKFDGQNHPHHRSMMKDGKKIKQDFQKAIIKKSSDGKYLTQNQFIQYYLDVNCCIPSQRQQFFVDNMIHTYHLLDNRITIDRLIQMQVTLFQKVRQKTYIKTDEGEKSKSGFRFFDMQDKGLVDYQRFVQTCQRLGCKFTDRQMRVLYLKHSGKDSLMTYQQMCALLFQMGSGLKDNTNPIYQLAKNNHGLGTTQGMSKKLF